MPIGGIVSAVVQVFQTLILVLIELFKMGREAVKELLDFQRSQPTAFTLVIGTMLAIFIITPLVFDFSWTNVLFGNTEYTEDAVATEVFLSQIPIEHRNNILRDMDLVKISENATTRVLVYPNTPLSLVFGEIPQFTIDNSPYSGGLPTTSYPSGENIIINTWNQGSDRFRKYQSQLCFELANQNSNTSAWEVVLLPDEPQLVKMLQLSVDNPELRQQDVWPSCYEAETDATTEVVLPGRDFLEKGRNLSLFIENGSICEDAGLNKMALESSDPFKSGVVTANPISWLAAFGNTSPFYWAYEGIRDFLWAQNLSSLTPTAPISCYIMVNRTSRQRFYKGVPQWLVDTGSPNTGLYTSLFYLYQTLSKPSVSQEEWQSLEAIEVKTPISFQPGVASIMLMPYQETKRTTNTLTLQGTAKYWEMFETVIIGVIMIIIGLSGVVLVLNAKEMKFR